MVTTNGTTLTPGTRLRDNEGKPTQQVVAVRTRTGLQQMHDLTIAHIHTYYVLAGDTPVLVHNSGPFCGTPFGKNAPGDELFHGTDYSLDEMTQFAYGHSGAGNPAMGRPNLGQIEATLRNAGPVQLRNADGSLQNAASFDYNGVRVIIDYDQPWKSTTYFPGSLG